jgi:hypothetical protein
MRASWSPRRARQMSNPRKRVVFRNVRLAVVPAEKFLGSAAVAQLVLDRIQHRISQVQHKEPLSENLEIH